MESLKKTEMIITLVNSVVILASIAYGYKKISALEKEVEELKNICRVLTQTINELKPHIVKTEQLSLAVKQQEQTIKSKDRRLLDFMEELTDTEENVSKTMNMLENITHKLVENGTIKLEQPPVKEVSFWGDRKKHGRREQPTTRRRSRDTDEDPSVDEVEDQVKEFERSRGRR